MSDQQPMPRTDVLAERIDGLGRRFGAVERQLPDLATKEDLTLLIKANADVTNTALGNVTEDVRELTKALSDERAERQALEAKLRGEFQKSLAEERTARETAIRELKSDSKWSRNFAVTALGLVVSIIVAVVGWVSQAGGTPV